MHLINLPARYVYNDLKTCDTRGRERLALLGFGSPRRSARAGRARVRQDPQRMLIRRAAGKSRGARAVFLVEWSEGARNQQHETCSNEVTKPKALRQVTCGTPARPARQGRLRGDLRPRGGVCGVWGACPPSLPLKAVSIALVVEVHGCVTPLVEGASRRPSLTDDPRGRWTTTLPLGECRTPNP